MRHCLRAPLERRLCGRTARESAPLRIGLRRQIPDASRPHDLWPSSATTVMQNLPTYICEYILVKAIRIRRARDGDNCQIYSM